MQYYLGQHIECSITLVHICSVVSLVYSGPTGVSALGRGPSSGGEVHLLGDSYYTSADVSRFQPQDVAIMAYNNQVVIHAEKVRTQHLLVTSRLEGHEYKSAGEL